MIIERSIKIDELNERIKKKGYKRARVLKKDDYNSDADAVFAMVLEKNGENNNLEILSNALGNDVVDIKWADKDSVLVKLESKIKVKEPPLL